MKQELNPERCEVIRQVFRGSDTRMGQINNEERSYEQKLNDARRQLSMKESELRNAQLRGVGANALNLLKGPVAGGVGLAIGNESNMTTLRLENEIKKLEGIIIDSQSKIGRLRTERNRLQQNDAKFAAEAKQLNCII